MPDPGVLIVFFVAVTALAIAPGPDNIFVLTQSALYGTVAGLVLTLGFCTGVIVHTAAVAFGVAAILAASETAFTVLKFTGAAYLLFLAWQALRAGTSDIQNEQRGPPTHWQLFGRGIIMNVTNPKVALFFLAFLPQFADPTKGAVAPQILVLGAIFILVTVLVFGLIAIAAGAIGTWLQRSISAETILNRVAAVVFTALAIRLIITEQ